MPGYDLVIKGGNVVDPAAGVHKADIGIRGEKIAAIAETIPASEGGKMIDFGSFKRAESLLAFSRAVEEREKKQSDNPHRVAPAPSFPSVFPI
jgi:predicted amidohydrolase